MVSAIALAVLAFTFIALIVGFIVGLVRGGKRSLLRLILAVVAVILAFCFKGTVTETLLNMDVGGQTLQESIVSNFTGETAFLADIVTPIVTAFISALAFAVTYLAATLATGIIVYPICKIFVRKPAEDEPKRTLLGGLLGIGVGVLIAYFLIVPVNGALVTAADLVQTIQDSSTGVDVSSVEGIIDYSNSGISKFYTAVGSPVFNAVANAKDAEGKSVTLNGQIQGVKSTIEIANKMSQLSDLNISGDITANDFDQIKNTLKELDDITADLDDESKEVVNKIIQGAISSADIGIDIDLSNVDFTEVNFQKEGEIFEDLYKYSQGESTKTAAQVIESLADSDVILPVIESTLDSGSVSLTAEQKAELSNAIDSVKDQVPADKINLIKSVFGLD